MGVSVGPEPKGSPPCTCDPPLEELGSGAGGGASVKLGTKRSTLVFVLPTLEKLPLDDPPGGGAILNTFLEGVVVAEARAAIGTGTGGIGGGAVLL